MDRWLLLPIERRTVQRWGLVASSSACPGEVGPVRQGEPLFADKDMRQHENLQRFPVMLDHRVIQHDREAL